MPAMRDFKTYLIIDNVRSAYNVGAMFRTAEAIGIEKIYLVGYTPSPIDRFGRAQKEIAKTALGAESNIPYEKHEGIPLLLEELKQKRIQIVSLEQTERAVDYKTYVPRGDTAFVVGNEVEGVRKELLDASSAVVFIPMRGEKESLNVSVAAGVALFRILDC